MTYPLRIREGFRRLQRLTGTYSEEKSTLPQLSVVIPVYNEIGKSDYRINNRFSIGIVDLLGFI